jgi:hypothetical protein
MDAAPETPIPRSPLPTRLPATGEPIPALTNAEIEEIFLQEDLERYGLSPSTPISPAFPG